MSTTLKSTPLAPADMAAMAERYTRQQLEREASNACHVFYLPSFRNNMLKLLQIFYSTPDWHRTVEEPDHDMPELTCLKYDLESPQKSTLQVRGVLSESPTQAGQAAVWLRIPLINYEKAGYGDRGVLAPNKSEQQVVKLFKGRLQLQADHDNHDVAVMLLEHALTFLEGTKAFWMHRMGLKSFDVNTLSDAQVLQPAPQRVVRATLTCVFQGSIDITAREESLALKRVISKITAAP